MNIEEEVQKAEMEDEVTESGFRTLKRRRLSQIWECKNTCEAIEVSEDSDETGEYSLNHTFLVALQQHLISHHGRGQTEREARKNSVDVAKFLNLSGPFAKPHNPNKLDEYMKYLEKQGKKASIQHAILCRIKQGLAYVNLSLDTAETVKAEKCMKAGILTWQRSQTGQ